jgi:hypothetical protein
VRKITKWSHLQDDTSENTIKAKLDPEDLRDYTPRKGQISIAIIDLELNMGSSHRDGGRSRRMPTTLK